jgi:hypothetical protein
MEISSLSPNYQLFYSSLLVIIKTLYTYDLKYDPNQNMKGLLLKLQERISICKTSVLTFISAAAGAWSRARLTLVMVIVLTFPPRAHP